MLVGMILAAGFGTRLKPLTDNLPKALVPFCRRPMIVYVIEKMKQFGVDRIIVNIHHKREKLIDFFEENDFGIEIILSDEKEEHLLTGGGIKNAVKYFGDSDKIIIHNTDIISSVNYNELLYFHDENKSDITLAIRKKNDTRVLIFDESKNLIAWKNKTTNEMKIRNVAKTQLEYGFTGIYILSKNVLGLFPNENKFEIIDFFLNTENKIKILGFEDKSEYWFDLGTREKIIEAERYLKCR